MKKKIGIRIRLFSFVLAMALAFTSAGMPSITVEAAGTAKVKKVRITSPKKSSITLNKGSSLRLKVKVTPGNAKNKKVAYKSSNKKVVKVTSKGKIKGLKNGTARITVTAKDGSKKKATLKVKVVTPVSKVRLNLSVATIKVGENVALRTTITPSGASNKKVTWMSSNPKAATVTSAGIVKGIAAGKAVITATAADGSKKKASCTVTVQSASGANPGTNPDNPNNPDKPSNPDDPSNPDKPSNPVWNRVPPASAPTGASRPGRSWWRRS